MGRSVSARKRHDQSEVRRMRGRMARSAARTCARRYLAAVTSWDRESSLPLLRSLVKRLDTAARKGVFARKAVARQKSRMCRLYNGVFSSPEVVRV